MLQLISRFPTILFLDSRTLSTRSLGKSNSSISTIIRRGSQESINSLCSLSSIPEARGVIFRAGSPSSDFDQISLKRRSFGGSLRRRGSLKLSKYVENDDIVIERSTTLASEEPSFWAESFSGDVRNVRDDSQLVFHVSCQDDDTPVNSDNESNEYDDKKRRESILNQMSLPQVLKDQGMTSLPSKVSFVFQ